MMVQQSGLINGKFDDLFDLWGKPNLCRDDVGCIADTEFNSAANLGQVHAEAAQYAGSNSFPFAYKTEQEMFGADVIMLEALGFFLSETQDLPGPLGELVKPVPIVHCRSPSFRYRSGKLLVSLYNKLFQTG